MVPGGSVVVDSFFTTRRGLVASQHLDTVEAHLGDTTGVHLLTGCRVPTGEDDRLTELNHRLRGDGRPAAGDLPCVAAGGHHDHLGHETTALARVGGADEGPHRACGGGHVDHVAWLDACQAEIGPTGIMHERRGGSDIHGFSQIVWCGTYVSRTQVRSGWFPKKITCIVAKK